MSSKKISLIGKGWLSSHFEKHLKEQGYTDVTSYSRQSENHYELGGTHSPSEELLASQIIFIMVPPSAPNYLNGLKELKHHFKETQKIVLIGSTGIYGQTQGDLNEEDSPLLNSERAKKLAAAEDIILSELSQGFVIRSAGQIGPDRNPVKTLVHKNIVLNGNARVNIIHSVDLCRIMELYLEESFQVKVLNAVSPYHPFKKDFYTDQAQSLNLPPPSFEDGPKEEKTLSSKFLEHFSFKKPRA